MNLIVDPDLIRTVLEQCRHGYPEERCGALLGYTTDAEARVAVHVLPLANQRDTERRTRYLIGPDEFRVAEARARDSGLDIVGFYHSHPDHPAIPSAFDREHAWPWYSYMIVPVHEGRPGTPRAWRLADDRSRFHELKIVQHATQATPAKEAS